jgi:hypothetical protein
VVLDHMLRAADDPRTSDALARARAID